MRLALMLIALVLGGCSDDQSSGTSPPANGAQGTASDSTPVTADAASITEMIRRRFGDAVARTVKVEVEDKNGLRVRLSGEVPSEQIRQDLMREISSRVHGIKFEDFNLEVSGAIPLVRSFEAEAHDGEPAIFSADGRLATTQRGEIWDIAAGRRLNRLGTFDLKPINCMAFSPDGKLLATGHNQELIILWDMPSGATHRILSPASDATKFNNIVAVAFSPDGKQLASISHERGALQLWDLASGSSRMVGSHLPESVKRGSSESYVLAFCPDGKTIASAESSGENAISIWDVDSRARKDQLSAEYLHPEALAWSADGTMLAAGRVSYPAPAVIVWALPSKKVRTFAPENGGLVRSVAFSPDGKTLATRFGEVGIILWDLQTGKEWQRLPMEKVGSGVGMSFSPDGNMLITECGIEPPSIRLWDVSSHPGAFGKQITDAQPFDVPSRDDYLEQEILNAIRKVETDRAANINVEVLPDGSVRLTGSVTYPQIKDSAGRIAETYRPRDKPGPQARRTVINELQVTSPRPDRGPPIRGK